MKLFNLIAVTVALSTMSGCADKQFELSSQGDLKETAVTQPTTPIAPYLGPSVAYVIPAENILDLSPSLVVDDQSFQISNKSSPNALEALDRIRKEYGKEQTTVKVPLRARFEIVDEPCSGFCLKTQIVKAAVLQEVELAQ